MIKIKNKIKEKVTNFPYRSYQKKHKCIFIHIPKNAGTSVLQLLGANPNIRDHINFNLYKKSNPVMFEEYFKFSIVRNPWDRALSIFNYLNNGGNGLEDIKFKQFFNDNKIDFQSFILDYLTFSRMHSHNLFRPQSYYILNAFGELQIDNLLRFENLSDDITIVVNKLNLNKGLPIINKSKYSMKSKYSEIYSEEMKRKIFGLYEEDIKKFDYHF